MGSESSEGIVLRLIEFSESSLIVTFFTRNLGKVVAIAKGARRPKSPFEGALDLLAVCRLVIITKGGESLDLLTEAKLERRFRAGQCDLNRLYAGFYFAELVKELTDRDDPHPEVYELLCQGLRDLDAPIDITSAVLRFELHLLRSLGHAPNMHACASCGIARQTPWHERKTFFFSALAGGIICERCRSMVGGLIQLRSFSCNWIDQVLTAEAYFSEDSPPLPECRAELRGAMNQYFSHLCGGPLRMTRYLSLL